MGVLGLTSFVENTPQLLLPLKIHDTRLVVDGHGLVHYLFHHSKIGYRHGGNYSEYEDLCIKFFKFLNLCNIKVYILFDGAHDLEDKKFRTTKERAKQQIQRSLNIINGGGDRILPVFAFEVFVKVMDVMEIPFVYCDFEADNDIVALANAWGCPVLSQDSDFFVFDVKAGYIQLTHFWWKNPCLLHAKKGEDEVQGCPVPDEEAPMVKRYYIKAEMYTLKGFCSHFNLNLQLVPLMASMLGNDYIPSETLNDFYCQVRLPARFVRSVSKRNSHIQGTICWLSEFEELNTAITAVLKYLRKTDREQIRQKLETSMQMYDLQVGSKFKNYFERCHMDSGLLAFPHCPALPGWSVALFRHGKFPFFCITVLCQRRHFTFNLIEDVTQKSCNRGSLNIRRVLYGILLNQFSIEESENNRDMQGAQVDKSKKTLHVMEFDRDNLDLRQTRVEPLFHLPKYGDVPGISNIPELAVASRKCLLMEVLGIDPVMVESFPLDIQLPIAVTVFWVNNADPKIVPSHLQALLLGFLKGCLSESLDQETQHCPETHEDDILSESKEVPGEDSAKVKGDEPSVTQQGAAFLLSGTDERTNVKQLLSETFRKYQNTYKQDRLNFPAVQAYAQWQSCMKYASFLNLVLCQPYPIPDLTKLYSGTLVHGMNCMLQSLVKVEPGDWIKSTLLNGLPEAYDLYLSLYTSVTSCLFPGAFFQKKSRKVKSVGRGQSSQANGQVPLPTSQPVTYEANCDILNRFAGLLTTDED